MAARLSRRGLLGAVSLGWLTAACGAATHNGRVPAPVTDAWSGATPLTGPEDSPHALAVDATHAYFATGGSQVGENAVRVVPLDASAPSRVLARLTGDLVPGGELVVNGDYAYVSSGASIVRITIADGTVDVVVPPRPGSISGLAVAGGLLWWSTSQLNVPSAAELCSMPLGGGAVRVLAAGIETAKRPYSREVEERRAVTVPGVTSISALAAVPGGVLACCSAGVLHSAGAAPSVLVARDEPVTQLAVLGDTAYFLQAGGRTSLYSVPVPGGQVTDLAADLDDDASLAIGGGQAFGVRRGGLGSGDSAIVAVPVGGGTPRVVSSGPAVGGQVALAGSTPLSVVFVGDSRVWTVPAG